MLELLVEGWGERYAEKSVNAVVGVVYGYEEQTDAHEGEDIDKRGTQDWLQIDV